MIDNVLSIIKEYNLGLVVQYILEHNTSQALPYHNFAHACQTMDYAYQAYCYEKEPPVPKRLLIAALFHDFNHSGGFFGTGRDGENIDVAIDAVEMFKKWVERKCSEKESGITMRELSAAEILIKYTEFPHEPIEELSGYSFPINCLRDADLMQCMNETMIQSITGIKEEYFKQVPWFSYLTKAIEFYAGLQYQTKWGKEVVVPAQKATVARLQAFKEICYPHC